MQAVERAGLSLLQGSGQRNALGRAPAGGGRRAGNALLCKGKGTRGRGWRRKKTWPLSITSWELVSRANPLPTPEPLKLCLGVGTPCALTSPHGAAGEPLGYRPGPLWCSLVFDEGATERIDQPVTHSLSCALASSENFKKPLHPGRAPGQLHRISEGDLGIDFLKAQ